jgi:hypothetical protein
LPVLPTIPLLLKLHHFLERLLHIGPHRGESFAIRRAQECTPVGYKYTLVLVSVTKRVLQSEMPEEYRLKFLGHLDKVIDNWLTPEMIAAIDPMDDKGDEIAGEIRKLGPQKALDVYAETFVAFAALNPSLIEALRMSPAYRYRYREAMQ